MAYLFLLALGLILLLMLLERLMKADVSLLFQTIRWTVVGVLLLMAFYLTLVGRLLHVAVIIGLLVFLFKSNFQKWMKDKKPRPLLLPTLTPQEARRLLKVKAKATAQEIEEAFNKINPKYSKHRDRLFQAKTLLLKKR